ncbi:MAG: hypothetical protein JGK03_15410 [Microcoleus sp. PH2017_25_DOB_D_A]|uniref:hypothetical protein n=1 Tax=unclassified Microcoleus TaxID=2642155 RepID=UPI001DEA3ED9|nr:MULTISPECIES: hypothetical protein [unclassified Microcoleus]MCC3509509.1 hypothetical protein [Microcoleus sp. PH2017_17_BER_D_A]MCC3535560.1 hypothetical protein [Microcoleus sp. PH2017_25_DOB_D_A]MCC3545472.1 hypothetical protein [Microcoleus sp. PH2017_24_DOB_U_A]MCC3600040.1 hypothetical protein [Microcoleus sp. PH2017_26_ELK_O_A]
MVISLHSIFLSAYLTIISRLTQLESDRHTKHAKYAAAETLFAIAHSPGDP